MKLRPEQEVQAIALIKSLELFSSVQEDALKAMAPLLDLRQLAKGKVVLMDQEIGKTLFLLAKGSVSVWKRVGGEKKQLATLQAPNFFGERTMFEESPASALVKTEEDSTIYALDRAGFDTVAQQFPGLSDLIHKNMVEVRAKRLGPVTPPQEDQG